MIVKGVVFADSASFQSLGYPIELKILKVL